MSDEVNAAEVLADEYAYCGSCRAYVPLEHPQADDAVDALLAYGDGDDIVIRASDRTLRRLRDFGPTNGMALADPVQP